MSNQIITPEQKSLLRQQMFNAGTISNFVNKKEKEIKKMDLKGILKKRKADKLMGRLLERGRKT